MASMSANESLPSRRGLYLIGVESERAIAGKPDETGTDEVDGAVVAAVVPLHPSAYASPARPALWAQTPARAA